MSRIIARLAINIFIGGLIGYKYGWTGVFIFLAGRLLGWLEQ